MIIPCSEKCKYEEEGLCMLQHATVSSGTPLIDCPYYVEKDEGENENETQN